MQIDNNPPHLFISSFNPPRWAVILEARQLHMEMLRNEIELPEHLQCQAEIDFHKRAIRELNTEMKRYNYLYN